MADQPITGLPTKTASGVASTDKMLGIDSAEGYQILVRDVAKYIIENCDVSTLAGAVRTPKAAIDLLNSKTLTRVSERSGYSISDAKLTMLNTGSDVGEDGFEVTAVRSDNTSFRLRWGRSGLKYIIGNTTVYDVGSQLNTLNSKQTLVSVSKYSTEGGIVLDTSPSRSAPFGILMIGYEGMTHFKVVADSVEKTGTIGTDPGYYDSETHSFKPITSNREITIIAPSNMATLS